MSGIAEAGIIDDPIVGSAEPPIVGVADPPIEGVVDPPSVGRLVPPIVEKFDPPSVGRLPLIPDGDVVPSAEPLEPPAPDPPVPSDGSTGIAVADELIPSLAEKALNSIGPAKPKLAAKASNAGSDAVDVIGTEVDNLDPLALEIAAAPVPESADVAVEMPPSAAPPPSVAPPDGAPPNVVPPESKVNDWASTIHGVAISANAAVQRMMLLVCRVIAVSWFDDDAAADEVLRQACEIGLRADASARHCGAGARACYGCRAAAD